MSFSSKRLSSNGGVNGFLRKHPAAFGGAFVFLIIGASLAMTSFADVVVEKKDSKISVITHDEEIRQKLGTARKFDIREEYYRHFSKHPNDEWDNVRIQRPDNVAEWGEAQQDTRKKVKELVRK
ncbi:SubName: Full=Uncharacterized protein {ECO:0000313/EMBL:CCA74796.1} [Serendipita indica DSM 11827]|uniref:Cytochrome c oxidase assembly protein COX16, mitochondrial n=1 Tax=Serendipita indica (strain DSM 11827) TaxID=1109443 RepID=G4TU03_SERID|nr:SubName: Full=Uncharacterized protein {ECO:0000313/EMBL:CCA74796.1} [Serendipita indica DSM 11827]CCA74796.1 hypothetical protein PIIN_08765 [Serendipita indica DSM 11827]